jgi:hypothetical protein
MPFSDVALLVVIAGFLLNVLATMLYVTLRSGN